MLQLSCFQAVRSHSRSFAHRFIRSRHFSIVSGDCQPPVDGSFHRSQVDADGKIFNFATVVVKTLDKGQSALPVWSQACALLGTSNNNNNSIVPTLAVAFVSKHTPSSAAAVEEIGKYFTEMIATESDLPLDPKSHAPFIGCVADLWSPAAPASTSPAAAAAAAAGAGVRRPDRPSIGFSRVPITEAGPEKTSQVKAVVKRSSDSAAEDSEEEDFKALVGECARWTRENPGVVPDAEELVSLDKELRSRSSSVASVGGGDAEVKKIGDSSSENEELLLAKEEEKSSSSLETKTAVRSESVSDSPVVEMNKTSDTSTKAIGEADSKAAEVAIAEADGGESTLTQGTATSDGGMQSSRDEFAIIDDDYRMILCVAQMPGTKAVAFHTSTTGLPYLPDIESAVVKNNPHMILLGAPGYPFPEFVQRLTTIFPESCRAGAFLSPLYSSPKVQRPKSGDDSKPLFAGAKQITSGIVGLSLSSDDDGAIPMDAFTEFLRMSLGMARIPGHTFLDTAISNFLFFPKNVVADRQLSSRSAPLDPGSLLKRLNTYLIRHSQVQTQSKVAVAAAGSSGQDDALKTNDEATTSIEVKSLLDESSSSSSIQKEDSQPSKSETLPLALLDCVLFPGWSMPLHMHEPRYRHLVRSCVEEGKPFGLTSYWHWQNSEELVGTMANLKVYLFEKDCRSYIVAHGVQRFRLLLDRMWVQPGSFGLNMGKVEFFDDDECEQKDELFDLAKRVVDRCRQLIPEAESAPGLVGSVTDPIKASFAVGQLLPVPIRVKRRWLSMSDTKFRLLEQMTFLNS